MDYLERNYKIVQERMIQQMENSLELGKSLIDTELDMGILNFLIRPIVKAFYEYWAQNDARSGTLKQIKITLDSGKRLLLEGNSDENFNKILEENFPKYFKADQTSLQCNKKHKNYKRLKQVAKETFINYLKELKILLSVNEDVNDYGDLCRVAFRNQEEAKKNLMKQIHYTDEGIKIIEEDPSILNIAVGRNLIVKALRKGFEQTKKDFTEALNDTYNQK
ncbi:MAG: hypothetical protein ACFE85_03580 [Candidatus Hodarchaeota archaeon]